MVKENLRTEQVLKKDVGNVLLVKFVKKLSIATVYLGYNNKHQ